jgi:hypothetical protein
MHQDWLGRREDITQSLVDRLLSEVEELRGLVGLQTLRDLESSRNPEPLQKAVPRASRQRTLLFKEEPDNMLWHQNN